MPRIIFIFQIFLLLVFSSGCQEVNIYLEYPDEEDREGSTSIDNMTSTPTLSPTRTPHPIQMRTSSEPEEKDFDVSSYFFPNEMLPGDVDFSYDSIRHYNVSYLNNPGSLLGIAHIQSYDADNDNLHVMQIIVQSPLPGQAEMLKAGHEGQGLVRDLGDARLGDYAMTSHLDNNFENSYQYRFYKGNIVVIVITRGNHSFVNQDNTHHLAKTIEEKLPDDFPAAEKINAPSLDLKQDLADEYFRQLDLIDCEAREKIIGNIQYRNQGLCFKADVIKLITNLKVGLYDERYAQIIFIKDFISAPQFGELEYGLLMSEWGFAWSELHTGDYQALFWVDDQLVKSIPFSLTKSYD